MPEWTIIHKDHSGTIISEFKPANDIDLSINRNAPSSATYQLARSDPKLTRDCFAPYRTDCFIYRDNDLVISGPHTSRKWSSSNEGVIDVAMQDWMHLLEKLYFPVAVTGDSMSIALRKLAWKQWGDEDNRLGISISTIVRELLEYRNDVDDLQWSVVVMPDGGELETKTFWRAMGLDSKTMYDHIKGIGSMNNGFDFDCKFISTDHIQVRLWNTRGLGAKATGKPKWTFDIGSEFIDLTWEDTGPIAARTYGTGQGHGPVGNLADVSVYTPSEDVYRALESIEDVGEIADLYQYDSGADEYRIVTKLTGTLGARNRSPEHKVDMTFNTSMFPFNWWKEITPGDQFRIIYDFGLHRINADWVLQGYTANINAQGDELITPDFVKILPNA